MITYQRLLLVRVLHKVLVTQQMVWQGDPEFVLLLESLLFVVSCLKIEHHQQAARSALAKGVSGRYPKVAARLEMKTGEVCGAKIHQFVLRKSALREATS